MYLYITWVQITTFHLNQLIHRDLYSGLTDIWCWNCNTDSGGIVLAIMSTFLTIIGLSGNLSSIKKSKYATLAYGITLLRVIKVRTQLKKFFSKISDFEENKRQYSGICPMVCCVWYGYWHHLFKDIAWPHLRLQFWVKPGSPIAIKSLDQTVNNSTDEHLN